MRPVLRWLPGSYGAGALHLLCMLCSLALAGYAAVLTSADSRWPLMLVWFGGALIVHDMLLFPLYALADRSIQGAVDAMRRRHAPGNGVVSPLNYVRIPALGAALTFLLYFPGIIGQGASTYQAATGQTQDPYLERWLLMCAVMFAVSAMMYAIRLARHPKAPRSNAHFATRTDMPQADREPGGPDLA